MLTELSVSLFSILLLPSLHNKVYTLFLYFSFLQTCFCNLLIFSLTNKFRSLGSSTCFIRRCCKFSNFSSFSILFCSSRFYLLLYSSSLHLFGLFFIHSNTVKYCFQTYVLSSPKNIIFLSKKKEAEIPF